MGNSYRPLLDKEVKEFREKLPNYTLGQIIFSMMTFATEGNFTKESLLNISDEELYKVCRLAMKREIELVSENDMRERKIKLGSFIDEALLSSDLSNSNKIKEWNEEIKEINKKLK